MQENELLEMISKETSWEEVINHIVAEEGMDPWDIDIVKLSDAFSGYLADIQTLDFKIPARLIIISAILIRMKVDIMMYEELEEEEEKQADMIAPIDLSKVPDLQAPITRTPTRKVTLDELVGALDKAFSTQTKREKREYKAREKIDEVMPTEEEFNVTERIEELYGRINSVLEELREGEMKFSSLVTKWTRKEVTESFVPVLHLASDGKITINQEEPFNEIYIKMRDLDEESED